jgi:hypothetical protein
MAREDYDELSTKREMIRLLANDATAVRETGGSSLHDYLCRCRR